MKPDDPPGNDGLHPEGGEQDQPETQPGLFTPAEWRRLAEALGLSDRQAQVAEMICAGLTYEAMALRLGLSVNTIRIHARTLFDKLDVHNRVEVVLRLVAAHRALTGREPE